MIDGRIHCNGLVKNIFNMSYTLAPLPRFRSLINILSFSSVSSKELCKPWTLPNSIVGHTSRSYWSLALILIWRMKAFPSKKMIIWLPDFFCDSTIKILRCIGAEIFFYKVNISLLPDEDSLAKLKEGGIPDIFLIVHYFGRPTLSTNFFEFFKKNNCWIVEDAAHVLKPIQNIGKYGNFVLFSPHKHLPLQNGAILAVMIEKMSQHEISKLNLNINFESQLINFCRSKNIRFKNQYIASLFWLSKRLIQKCGVIKNISKANSHFLEKKYIFKQEAFENPRMSKFSKAIIKYYLDRLDEISIIKHKNLKALDYIISTNPDLDGLIQPFLRPQNFEWLPYIAGFICSPGLHYKLDQISIPFFTWPDLPDEVFSNNFEYKNSTWLEKNIIYFPIHDSISFKKITKNLILNEKALSNSLDISSCMIIKSKRENLFCSDLPSNLIQTRAWGEAKKIEGWQPENYSIKLGAISISNFQILQKKYFRFLTVIRINRGPIFNKELNFYHKILIYEKLAKFGNWKKLKILTFAPEIKLDGESIVLMKGLGFIQRQEFFWESILVDLSKPIEDLRTNLSSKWRNLLNFSERSEIVLKVDFNADDIDWLLARYRELMASKRFVGTSPSLLKELSRLKHLDVKLLVLYAIHNDNIIGSVCLACHGNTATYLIGWTGELGRNLKANYFLLWNAIKLLKKSNFKYLDLGGIDENSNASVAHFKLGIGGVRYNTLGEFLKF